MFTIKECTQTAEVTDLFRKTLLVGNRSKVFEVLNDPQLGSLWNKYFAGRTPKTGMYAVKGGNDTATKTAWQAAHLQEFGGIAESG